MQLITANRYTNSCSNNEIEKETIELQEKPFFEGLSNKELQSLLCQQINSQQSSHYFSEGLIRDLREEIKNKDKRINNLHDKLLETEQRIAQQNNNLLENNSTQEQGYFAGFSRSCKIISGIIVFFIPVSILFYYILFSYHIIFSSTENIDNNNNQFFSSNNDSNNFVSNIDDYQLNNITTLYDFDNFFSE